MTTKIFADRLAGCCVQRDIQPITYASGEAFFADTKHPVEQNEKKV
jgi:hypothetical protein